MGEKYYQFDYAEMKGAEVGSMGILNIRTSGKITSSFLKEYARRHLQMPDAVIIISNITKLTKKEFDELEKLAH